MLIIKKEEIQDIPILHLAHEQSYNEKLPLVIFLHGFTSGKERNLHYAYKLAEKGLRVILPDAPLHGEREMEISNQERNLKFWDIVVEQIHEVNIIKEEMDLRGVIDNERICLAGTSMGGIVTFGSLTQYDWIKAAVSLRGTPTYEIFARGQLANLEKDGPLEARLKEKLLTKIEQLRTFDLTLVPPKVETCPIFIWHGEQDEVVPFKLVETFYNDMRETNHFNEKITFISDPKSGHEVTREGIDATVKWIGENL